MLSSMLKYALIMSVLIVVFIFLAVFKDRLFK